MKIQKFIWIMIITFMLIISNLNCQYDKNIDSIMSNYNNWQTKYATYSMINYDSVRIAVKKYDSINQKRFKDIFIKNHLKDFVDENEDFCEQQNLNENLDSLRIKTIPRFHFRMNKEVPKFYSYFEIDYTVFPERVFVFYKQTLLGFYYYIYNNDKSFENNFYQLSKMNDYDSWYFNCLSSKDVVIEICYYGKVILTGTHILDLTTCHKDKGFSEKYYITEKELIKWYWHARLSCEDSCPCDQFDYTYSFY